jgi:hypothetical protein
VEILNTYFGYAGLGLVGGYAGIFAIAVWFGHWSPFEPIDLYSILAIDYPILFFVFLFIQILGGYLGGAFIKKGWGAVVGGFILGIIFSIFVLLPLWF